MKKDIIIFMGQSNMQGETEGISGTDEVRGALEYKYASDRLVPLKNPVGEDVSVLLAPTNACTTLLPSFAESYIRETGKEIVAVHAARGSTTVSYWLPQTEGYRAVVAKSAAAIRKVGREKIGHIYAVWLQGESDMISKTSKEEYIQRMILLKNGLKQELGIDKFALIKVAHFSSLVSWLSDPIEERKRCDEIILDAQEALPQADEDFILLTRIADELICGDEKYQNPNVEGHFSSLGLETIGQTAGTNLARYVLEQEKEETSHVETLR